MNLLITGAWNCTKDQLEELVRIGHDVFFLQDEKDELQIPYECVEGIICNGLFQHHPIEQFINLRYIQLTSAGFDRVPLDYISSHNIEIHNARGVYSIPMAEFAIAGVLQLYKQSRFFAENQKQHRWKKHRGLLELYGKHVCIVGCGSVGTECAKRFSAFGCRVTGVDIIPRKDAYYTNILELDCLDDIIPEEDIVVLTLPLTEKSRYLMNKQRLERMKYGAVLVNIARGAIIDTAALVEWLNEKRGAAILDVFEEEPVSQKSALWQMENVVVTPHNSFVSDSNGDRLFGVIKSNLQE